MIKIYSETNLDGDLKALTWKDIKGVIEKMTPGQLEQAVLVATTDSVDIKTKQFQFFECRHYGTGPDSWGGPEDETFLILFQ